MLDTISTRLSALWSSIFADGRHKQVAALCYRQTPAGKRVLLITSRDSGRWIVPKGWPIRGLADPDAALQEAWEEAGVSSARVQTAPLGSFGYDKGRPDGTCTPIRTQVYLTQVESLASSYPEAHQRQRRWFTPEEAADKVSEPDLKAILRTI